MKYKNGLELLSEIQSLVEAYKRTLYRYNKYSYILMALPVTYKENLFYDLDFYPLDKEVFDDIYREYFSSDYLRLIEDKKIFKDLIDPLDYDEVLKKMMNDMEIMEKIMDIINNNKKNIFKIILGLDYIKKHLEDNKIPHVLIEKYDDEEDIQQVTIIRYDPNDRDRVIRKNYYLKTDYEGKYVISSSKLTEKVSRIHKDETFLPFAEKYYPERFI
jgi:hypothetical protein